MSELDYALRSRQREHALLLLKEDEFASLQSRGQTALPPRHREHFAKVMRRNKSWRALACDGCGRLVEAEITGQSVILTDKPTITLKPKTRRVRLVQAMPKPKALSLILQKGAELGASEIVLAHSDFAAPTSEKPDRMTAILENACMQAYNPWLPQLLSRPLAAEANFQDTRAYFGDLEGSQCLKDLHTYDSGSVTFFNGPEGGFSANEREFLRQRATGLLLSENVLRSETAAIIALGYFCQKP